MSLYTAAARPVKLHHQLCCSELARVCNSVDCVFHALALDLQQNNCTTSDFYAAVLLDKLGIINDNPHMGH